MMNITPKQFAEWLKRSTLSPSEQQAVLDLLPKISPEQIYKIAELLRKDVHRQSKVLAAVTRERDKLILQFDLEMKRIDAGE
tara:strand:+ start:228 stop:473 length:246 start_codon:yes stop_codon:yes gene_type:complete